MLVTGVLLSQKVRIPVLDGSQSIKVQEKLFSIGYGFHTGVRLKQELERDWDVLALAVSTSGMMTCFVRNHDEKNYEESVDVEIKPEDLLSQDISSLRQGLNIKLDQNEKYEQNRQLLSNVRKLDHKKLTEEQLGLLRLVLSVN